MFVLGSLSFFDSLILPQPNLFFFYNSQFQQEGVWKKPLEDLKELGM